MQLTPFNNGKWGKEIYLVASLIVIAYSTYSVVGHGMGWPFLGFIFFALLLFLAVPLSPWIGLAGYLLIAHGLPRYSPPHDLLLVSFIPDLLCVLLALWLLLHTRNNEDKIFIGRLPIVLMILFILWVGLSYITMLFRDPLWQPYIRHHPLLFFQALVLFLYSAVFLRGERKTYALAFVICLIPALRWLLQSKSQFYLEGDLALISALALVMGLVAAAHAREMIWRIGFALTAMHATAMLFLTQNRGAAVAVVVALGTIWLSAQRKTLMIAAGLAFIVIMITIATPADYWNRFRAIGSLGTRHATAEMDRSTVQQRVELWRAGYEMALDHPWIGVGIGNYANAVILYNPTLAKLPAHNSLVSIAAETGIPGLLLFLALIVSVGVMLYRQIGMKHSRNRQISIMLLAGILNYFVGGLFISRHDSPLLYLLLGWAVATSYWVGKRAVKVTCPSQPVNPN